MTLRTNDPTDALAVLGNETRMAILRELADADEPLSFTDLRRRAGIRDTGKFNYHLEKLRAHYIRRTEAGYELDRRGTRVIEATEIDSRDVVSHDEELSINEGELCPVCETEDCQKLFRVHLTPPWA